MHNESNNDFKLLIPGLCQGITRVSISYPFDVVKITMQKQLFKNATSAILFYIKNDPKIFYRGSIISYTTVSLERSVQFYFLEKMNKKFNYPYLNGFILSLGSQLYNIPSQFITTNIVISNLKPLKYIKYLFENKINVYKGSFLEICRGTINSTIFMGTYYQLRNKFGDNSSLASLYGAISGSICWIITYPIDTIRTDYQSSNNNNIIKLIKNRYNKYGIISFYRGLTTVLFRTIPSASLGMYVYENVRNYIMKTI
jgi:hypothetical protein